jgi:phage terminase Nu1 subunit (DNA packaging protein)
MSDNDMSGLIRAAHAGRPQAEVRRRVAAGALRASLESAGLWARAELALRQRDAAALMSAARLILAIETNTADHAAAFAPAVSMQTHEHCEK